MVSSNISLESIYCHTSPHSVSISICIAFWVALPSKNGTQGQDGWRWLLFHQHLCMAWSSILTHVARWQLNGLGITDFNWMMLATFLYPPTIGARDSDRLPQGWPGTEAVDTSPGGDSAKICGTKTEDEPRKLGKSHLIQAVFIVFQGFFMLCVCVQIDRLGRSKGNLPKHIGSGWWSIMIYPEVIYTTTVHIMFFCDKDQKPRK